VPIASGSRRRASFVTRAKPYRHRSLRGWDLGEPDEAANGPGLRPGDAGLLKARQQSGATSWRLPTITSSSACFRSLGLRSGHRLRLAFALAQGLTA